MNPSSTGNDKKRLIKENTDSRKNWKPILEASDRFVIKTKVKGQDMRNGDDVIESENGDLTDSKLGISVQKEEISFPD
ncbi:unnamed protein product, partial [Mesorhabditis belari]|uniref:Uncharacterized protein n=1 Tax=Mesorhabditis belari TaxID=2138241 RepID=A0AAF3JAS6_9BILA